MATGIQIAGSILSLLSVIESAFTRHRPLLARSQMGVSWKERERGYPQLSAYIAADEDKSITIYRRFERLAARNLLYLESELAELEAKQDELDRQSRDDEDKIAATWNLQQIGTLAVALEKESRSKNKKTRLETVSESTEENVDRKLSSRDGSALLEKRNDETMTTAIHQDEATLPPRHPFQPAISGELVQKPAEATTFTLKPGENPETAENVGPQRLQEKRKTPSPLSVADILVERSLPGKEVLKPEAERDLELKDKLTERLKVAAAIRKALREYYEALKLESDILALNNPSHRVVKDLRKDCDGQVRNKRGHWIHNYEPLFKDTPMENRLSDEKDLCVLAPPVERDRLTKFLEGPFSLFFRDTSEGGEEFVSHRKVEATVSLISMITALLFLLGALWGLYAVADAAAQMIMLSAFTVSFGGALGLLTNARRQDVFAATAAYTAVLVVFISTNMASTWGTVPPPPEVAVTVTVLGAGTNSSSLNLTATTMVPSTGEAPAPSLTSRSSTTGFIVATSFALLAICIALMVMLWKISHSYKSVKEHVPKSKQKARPMPWELGAAEQGNARLSECPP